MREMTSLGHSVRRTDSEGEDHAVGADPVVCPPWLPSSSLPPPWFCPKEELVRCQFLNPMGGNQNSLSSLCFLAIRDRVWYKRKARESDGQVPATGRW